MNDIAYAAIAMAHTALWTILGGWLLYFYAPPGQPALVPVALYGIAMLALRGVSIVTDPLIGYLSDHTRSRWGRRLPWMAGSALPLLVLFILLWMPPVKGESIWNLVYLAAVLGLYNIAYSLSQIPYEALLPEIARTEQQRVRMSAWYSGAQLVGMILGGLAGWLIDGRGYVVTAAVYTGAVLPMFYLPFLVLRERPENQIDPQQRLSFKSSLQAVLQNSAFGTFAVIWSLYWCSLTIVQAIIPFLTTEVCLLTEADTMLLYIPAILASLACYPAVTWLSKKLGRRKVFITSALASAAIFPGTVLIGLAPQALVAQGIAWSVLQAVGISGVAVLSQTFFADLTDIDEKNTGQRREGAYASVFGVLDHLVTGLASTVLSTLLLLGRSRLDIHGPLGVRLTGVAAGLMMLVACILFWRRRQS